MKRISTIVWHISLIFTKPTQNKPTKEPKKIGRTLFEDPGGTGPSNIGNRGGSGPSDTTGSGNIGSASVQRKRGGCSVPINKFWFKAKQQRW